MQENMEKNKIMQENMEKNKIMQENQIMEEKQIIRIINM